VRHVPMTDELRVQQVQSMRPEEQWWYECLMAGKVGNIGWGAFIAGDDMYEDYQAYARNHGARLLNRIEFARRMGSFFSTEAKTKPKRMRGELIRAWELYDLDVARKFFDDRFEAQSEWPATLSAATVTLPNPFVGP